MDRVVSILGKAGAWCGRNKYLFAIKNAFQSFMPFTIAGAMGVLWTKVLVNSQSGLGSIWKPIMALEFLNPAFEAIQFATISCITVGITFAVALEIGNWKLKEEETSYFPGILGVVCWLAVSRHDYSYALIDQAKETLMLSDTGGLELFTGLSSDVLGATGLFTGIIIAIVSIEIFSWLVKRERLKIRMPETVAINVAKSFEVLIPAFITILIISFSGLACNIISENLTGNVLYLNDIIKTSIQGPLSNLAASVPGVIIIYLIIMLFWLIGIHGNNMLAGIKESLFTPLAIENMQNFKNDQPVEHIFTMPWLQMFGEFGGSGVTIGLVLAIFIFSKREDNRTVAKLSLLPAIFNMNETVIFGVPLILNPILGIPFVLTPIITILVGYGLTYIGFCPKTVITPPWLTPPIIYGFVATGADIRGALSQAIVLVVSVLCYAPFLIAYERMQNREAAKYYG